MPFHTRLELDLRMSSEPRSPPARRARTARLAGWHISV